MTSLDFEELVNDRGDTINGGLVSVTNQVDWTVHAHLAIGLRKLELGSCGAYGG
jgi:hypothetical protein